MHKHDWRDPTPAGPLFGLSPEEAWRRFAFSGRQPSEVYAHPGPWSVAILLWPHSDAPRVAGGDGLRGFQDTVEEFLEELGLVAPTRGLSRRHGAF